MNSVPPPTGLPLPMLDWSTATREQAQQYLRVLLDASGFRRGRGHVLPTPTEIGEALEDIIGLINARGWQTSVGPLALQMISRMLLAEFNRFWPLEGERQP